MYGGAVGSSSSQASNPGLQQRYDNAFAQCMVLLGHQTARRGQLPPRGAGDAAATARLSAAQRAAAVGAAAEHAPPAGRRRADLSRPLDQPCSRLLRGTLASRKSIWSARMRRPRRIMSSCRLGT